MHRAVLVLLAALALLLPQAGAIAQPPAPSATPDDAGLSAYTVGATARQAAQMRADHMDIATIRGVDGDRLQLEVVMTQAEAAALSSRGLTVTLNPGQADVAGEGQRSFAQTAADDGVFRPYGGPGGLAEEMTALAAEHPAITDLQVIGQSGLGTDILALKVSKDAAKDADRGRDGRKPAVVYISTQHAREWIAPEVNRRLLRHILEGYASDAQLKSLVDKSELWFVLVANPDGYDYSFSDDRLWRKTLRDNNGDGQISGIDGVDPNRNFPTFWAYDNEGSSDDPSDPTYRGPSPASEPETRALDQLVGRITPEFLVNWHSAARLILYGVGHQVATPTPDDVILAALAGDDATPAVPGFDPDISAELYTTNGETLEHMAAQHGTLGFTPELSECYDVAPEEMCSSSFEFPDDETLIQAEFERNLAFALDVARSARDPYEMSSHLGNTLPDYVLDTFAVSHGTTQTVAATVSREIHKPKLEYRVNNAKAKKVDVVEWQGGERYGGDFDTYYAELRGEITGLQPGDTVEWWLKKGGRESAHATFTVAEPAAEVLILANEDYDGYTPEQALASPAHLSHYTAALDANGVSWDVWDIDLEGAPHDLGVLSHYGSVIWYVGDNVITQDLEDRDILFPESEIGVAEVMQHTTLAVRDYLNEGGSLLKTGDRAGYFGQFASFYQGLYYGDDGAPDQPCTVEVSVFTDCLLLSDDFHQYWLGDFGWRELGSPGGVVGQGAPMDGLSIGINGGDSADNAQDSGQSVVTSSVLDPSTYPLFADSHSIADYPSAGPDPYAPLSGDFYAGILPRHDQYNRFSRTVDLTGATAASLSFATSFDVEHNYDFFVVEAHTVGQDDWTTLEDLNGGMPEVDLYACSDGLWDGVHDFIFEHYVDYDSCTSPGPTGEFHAFNGGSGGWVDASFDLTPFAGGQVEVSLTYISDIAFANTGAFVDDVVIEIDGAQQVQGWEDDDVPWVVTPPPAGSPDAVTKWTRSDGLITEVLSAAVATDSTVYLPFGFEAISTAAERAEVMGRLLDHLLD